MPCDSVPATTHLLLWVGLLQRCALAFQTLDKCQCPKLLQEGQWQNHHSHGGMLFSKGSETHADKDKSTSESKPESLLLNGFEVGATTSQTTSSSVSFFVAIAYIRLMHFCAWWRITVVTLQQRSFNSTRLS